MPNLNGAACPNSKLLRFPLTGSSAPAARPVKPSLVEKKSLAPSEALAHDARNALASLQLIAGLLGSPGVLAETHRHLAADVEMLSAALNGFVQRFETIGHAKLERKESAARSASEAVTACSRLLETVAGPRVAVHVSAESGLGALRIDEDALHRVLSNLVKNASEAMPNGGTVRVTARRALSFSDPTVLIQVADNGPGIPAWALDQIFEPGWSTKADRKVTCGLGLAIVRELVEAAGGTVRVGSTPRRGTTFELRLPTVSR